MTCLSLSVWAPVSSSVMWLVSGLYDVTLAQRPLNGVFCSSSKY